METIGEGTFSITDLEDPNIDRIALFTSSVFEQDISEGSKAEIDKELLDETTCTLIYLIVPHSLIAPFY